jgi:hypothetical protein
MEKRNLIGVVKIELDAGMLMTFCCGSMGFSSLDGATANIGLPYGLLGRLWFWVGVRALWQGATFVSFFFELRWGLSLWDVHDVVNSLMIGRPY